MRRRRFLSLFGAAMLATAQGRPVSAAGPPRVGILDPGLPAHFDAFFSGMRDLGYFDGKNIDYVRGSAAGQAAPIAEQASELVGKRVDVIVTAGPEFVKAAMKATSTIPIVFAALGDAVGAGVVASLAHPDRNVTGLSFLNPEVGSKRVEVLREMLPEAHGIAFLFHPEGTTGERETAIGAAKALGLTWRVLEVTKVDEFPGAFAAAQVAGAQAIDVLASPYFNANKERLVALAAERRLPAVYESAEYVRAGGLVSYGANIIGLFRQAAGYVDKILKGAKPADLPVQQPTKFELVINLKTAKALGLTVPPSLLARADEVVE